MRNLVHIALLALFVFAQSATAQNVLGSAVIDGKKVELIDDGTWRYASPRPTGSTECSHLNSVIAFCGSDQWRSTNVPSPDFLAAYQLNARAFGGIIYEAIGSADGMNGEFMRKILIQYAASASGIPESAVPVLELVDSTVDGQQTETMVYAINLNGLDIVYQNTLFISEAHTVQFLVWTIGSEYTDEQKEISAQFIENIRIDLGSQ